MTLRESLDRCCRGVASTQEGDEVRAAVLNLIEAAQALRTARDANLSAASFNISVDEVCEAVAVFVSGQEEPK